MRQRKEGKPFHEVSPLQCVLEAGSHAQFEQTSLLSKALMCAPPCMSALRPASCLSMCLAVCSLTLLRSQANIGDLLLPDAALTVTPKGCDCLNVERGVLRLLLERLGSVVDTQRGEKNGLDCVMNCFLRFQVRYVKHPSFSYLKK